MKRWFLSLLLLANCAPFGEAPADTTSDQAATTPTKKASTPSTTAVDKPPTGSASSDASSVTATTASALWQVVGKKVVIPVCYDATFPTGLRGEVTQMVKAQWNQLSPLSFTGFTDCVEGDVSTVRVMGSSIGSKVEGLGFMTGAMILLDTTGDQDTLAATALHELGHVAGLGHEAFPSNDDSERSLCAEFMSEMGIANDLPIEAPADRDVLDPGGSVMSRCHVPSPGISQADNAAIAKIYGVPAVDWSSIGGGDDINE